MYKILKIVYMVYVFAMGITSSLVADEITKQAIVIAQKVKSCSLPPLIESQTIALMKLLGKSPERLNTAYIQAQKADEE